jgi:hypothetical protein
MAVTVEVNDPPVPAEGSRVKVDPTGKLLDVRVKTSSLSMSGFSISIDNYTTILPLAYSGTA